MNEIEKSLKNIIKKYSVQPAGSGYIDCICPKENIEGFISALSELNVTIEGFTWWCFSDSSHEPCGMGGPRNKYGEGFYSEMQKKSVFDKYEDNESYKNYLLNEFLNSREYQPCLVPGFWLILPEE